jgi:hypothetical protein
MTYNGFALILAEWTGLEPATPGVTGRYSNQLNYHSMTGTALCAAPAQNYLTTVASPRGFEPLLQP